MSVTSVLHKQFSAIPVGDSTFGTASLVFTVTKSFDAPVEAVWTAIDDDHAWKWLPFPGVGVRYDSPERGAGVVREMGSVFGIVRPLWVEQEQFWRYEPQRRITFGVISGNWMQYLLVREYAENMDFARNDTGGTDVMWTVAVTPRLPFRFVKFVPAVWRLAYRQVGIGPLFARRVAAVTAELPTPPAASNGHRRANLAVGGRK